MVDDSFVKWIVGTLFSGIGTTWLAKCMNRKGQGSIPSVVTEDNIPVSFQLERNHKDYKTRLGAHHESIRSGLLRLSDRQMADFYGFETVTELIEFETGVRELPKNLLMKLCNFFFLKEEIFDLDVEVKFPFKSFCLHYAEIEHYLNDGFKPVIACNPNDRVADLTCSILMTKKENGFNRVISSDRNGRFRSGHGGKMNVEQLIHAMIKAGKYDTDVRIVKVDSEEWSAIQSKKFYQNLECNDLDWDCQDIFDRWYLQYDKKFGNELRAQWMNEHSEN